MSEVRGDLFRDGFIRHRPAGIDPQAHPVAPGGAAAPFSPAFPTPRGRTMHRGCCACSCSRSRPTAADPPLLLQRPAVSAKQVAFAYAGDLWVVDRAGGDARRLTAGVGLESYPVFSPDGSRSPSPASTRATSTSTSSRPPAACPAG